MFHQLSIIESTKRLILRNRPNIRRSVSTCVHIKGLPVDLSNKRIYDFFRDYGKITNFTTFQEAPQYYSDKNNRTVNSHDIRRSQKKNFIFHNRLPGQTAVIAFETASSAIMVKDQLHWRPFPIMGVDDDQNDIVRPLVDENIVSMHPRDRPILNILFETSHMKSKLRHWVQNNLLKSPGLIRKWEGQDANNRKSKMKMKLNDSMKELRSVEGTAVDDNDDDFQPRVEEIVCEDPVKQEQDEETGIYANIPNDVKQVAHLSIKPYDEMKLVELQEECRKRNIPYYGRKIQLINRLESSADDF